MNVYLVLYSLYLRIHDNHVSKKFLENGSEYNCPGYKSYKRPCNYGFVKRVWTKLLVRSEQNERQEHVLNKTNGLMSIRELKRKLSFE